MNLRELIDSSPMRGGQWAILIVCTFLNALDGYDVLAMAFTANPVSQEFGLSGTELGFLLSAGLIGMAVGAVGFGPLADVIGRRRTLLIALVVNALGLFLSATAGSMGELLAWRVVTGLGVGGILASATVLVSEYANVRRRGLAISIFTAGYPLGATLGGMAAAWLIANVGWHAVFLLGGILTVVSIVLVALLLPESIDYLAQKPTPANAKRAERIAVRLGHGEGAVLPEPVVDPSEGAGVGAVFAPRYRLNTIMVWITFFIVMFGFYFANSWTPKLVVASGMSEQQGIMAGIMITTGGIIGAVLYGVFTARWPARFVFAGFVALGAVMLCVFILSTDIIWLAFGSALLVGTLMNGAVSGLYTVAPNAYGPRVRSTGVGVALGVGRAGAILAPIIVGAFLDAGWTPTHLYIGVAIIVLFAVFAIIRIKPYVPSDDTRAVGTVDAPEPVIVRGA
ncbi:MFS transporter [Gulosibacter macacae]|uniref:MFS transporter n=1 Tax=Gulosibacter macacae TaxID=2488791 RepID=A0A3P3W3L8_9MICO|nr:MFS transporter [Gulosibacter macacae]RRJ88259.1 MFS transporter [Gulosibacter macacae]